MLIYTLLNFKSVILLLHKRKRCEEKKKCLLELMNKLVSNYHYSRERGQKWIFHIYSDILATDCCDSRANGKLTRTFANCKVAFVLTIHFYLDRHISVLEYKIFNIFVKMCRLTGAILWCMIKTEGWESSLLVFHVMQSRNEKRNKKKYYASFFIMRRTLCTSSDIHKMKQKNKIWIL